MLPAYKVRLQRWQEEGDPPSRGLSAFVAALRSAGDSDVLVAEYGTRFILLFPASMDSLLAPSRSTPPEKPRGSAVRAPTNIFTAHNMHPKVRSLLHGALADPKHPARARSRCPPERRP